MINIVKTFSFFGMIAATAWFFLVQDFAAVLIGIFSLSAFMIAFLPIANDQKV